MNLGIEDRVAIVSGSSKGIGRAIARALALEGARVVVTGRTRSTLLDAAEELASIVPGHVDGVVADMRSEAEVRRVAARAREVFGPISIAVSNIAGYADAHEKGPHASHFDDLDPNELDMGFEQLLLSAWHLARATVPDMQANRWGRIVNVSSRVVKEAEWDLPHVIHNVVRPAVHSMHQALAAELAPYGITVNSTLTGSISTERNLAYWRTMDDRAGEGTTEDLYGLSSRAGISDLTSEQRHHRIALKRPGRPEEYGAVVAFLCSERASHITGQGIPLDGGTNRSIC